jgi:hypothetical protein
MSEQNDSSPYVYDEPKKLNPAAKYFIGGIATAAVALVGAQIVLPAIAQTFNATSELPGEAEAAAETFANNSIQNQASAPASSHPDPVQASAGASFGIASVRPGNTSTSTSVSADPIAVPGLSDPASPAPIAPKPTLVAPDFAGNTNYGNVSSATPAVGGSSGSTAGGATNPGARVSASREDHDGDRDDHDERDSDDD